MTNGKRTQTSAASTSHDNISDTNNSPSKDQERFLPVANVGRIMKKFLPNNAKISKEAEESVQECVSEFISFITGEASDKCQREKRKTINGDDLLWAMTTLGFEKYVAPLKVYLNQFRETDEEKKTSIIDKSKEDRVETTTSRNTCFRGIDQGAAFTIDREETEVDRKSYGEDVSGQVGYGDSLVNWCFQYEQ